MDKGDNDKNPTNFLITPNKHGLTLSGRKSIIDPKALELLKSEPK